MPSIKVRLDRLEARYGGTSFEDMVRRMPTEVLETLLALYTRANANPADEAIVAEIERIEGRYR